MFSIADDQGIFVNGVLVMRYLEIAQQPAAAWSEPCRDASEPPLVIARVHKGARAWLRSPQPSQGQCCTVAVCGPQGG